MKTYKHHHPWGFTLMELLVVITIIVALAGLSVPQITRTLKAKDRLLATHNATQLFAGLSEFSQEYGSLPDRSTATAVIDRTDTKLKLDGDSANDYFRQLIAAGLIRSEDPFYAPTANSKRKPDNIFDGDDALKPGEVGFGYILNGNSAMPLDYPGRFIAVSPLTNAAKGEFDPGAYWDKVVALCADGSVQHLDIRPDSHKAHVAKGKTLLETGPGTRWGTEIHPVIKAPKFK
ncbi:MAG: type II secretion system GspH family protein [Akkermansiaceae bacterium]|nr:type II secretion system GspH family protein [Akkermansiaceae bacterium]